MLEGTFAFDRQRIHHRILEGAGDVGTRLIVVAVGANGVGGEGFQPGEAEVQPRTIGHRPREGETPRRALLRHLRQHRPAGIIQAEQLGGFVERFAGGIVDRLAQQCILTDAGDADQLSVATGDQQRDERERRRVIFQHRRQQVAFHVVYRHCRHVPGERQRTPDGSADQQRAYQARPGGISHAVDIGRSQVGLFQRRLNQRHGFAHVIAGGQFRHHAAVVGVQLHLAV